MVSVSKQVKVLSVARICTIIPGVLWILTYSIRTHSTCGLKSCMHIYRCCVSVEAAILLVQDIFDLKKLLLWLQEETVVYEGQYHVVQETSEKVHFHFFGFMFNHPSTSQSHETMSMGGVPYKFAKRGLGTFFECFCF